LFTKPRQGHYSKVLPNWSRQGQRIALEHHGVIHMHSDPGKGSRFSLSLPAFTTA